MHNFTTPLKDTEANAGTFTPGALGYSLSGLPTTGKSLLFQKSNGNYDLVIWNNVTNWDFSAGTPITISPTNVDITFGSIQGVLNVYDPVVSSTPIVTVSNTNTVSVVLKDYPIVVEALSASAPEAPEKSQ
jgi:serralysin